MLDISVRINDLFMFVNGLARNSVQQLSRPRYKLYLPFEIVGIANSFVS